MKAALPAILFSLALVAGLPAQPAAPASATDWEKSIVRIEISRKSYDYYQPWARRTDRVFKVGLVVGEREILTTAQDVSDRTLVRIQKDGRGPWTEGTLAWVDYYANLALITSADAALWSDLKPAVLMGGAPAEGTPLQILRWREGKLENRRAEFTQFAVRQNALSALSHMQLEMDSEIQGAGWGEPAVANTSVLGIVAEQRTRACKAIPAAFIRAILEARRAGAYRGLGYFHFYWQPAANTASLAQLGLPGSPRGVLVNHVPERADGAANVVQPRDIILRIDGFDVDIQGDYRDPEYGTLMLENLAMRGKWAGDDVQLTVWRGGKSLDLTYRLPKYEYSHAVVPRGVYDQAPEYLIVGGLVFQPLTYPYLQRWGAEWERRAPFRLTYFTGDDATKEQTGVVILSQVLPDPFNIGYQDQRYQVLKKANDRPINNLADLREALKQPKGEFHILEFLQEEASHRIVLAAGDAERQATRRVLERYRIEEDAFIAAKPTAR